MSSHEAIARLDLTVVTLAFCLLAVGAATAAQTPGPWVPEAPMLPDDGESNDQFGWSVAVDGGTAIVGAENDDNANGDRAGAAYVYTQAGTGAWIQQAKLTAGDGEELDAFGTSVALDGDQALVGAKSADNADGLDQGAAYIFDRTGLGGWEQEARLQAEDGDFADEFGISVDLDGDTALVGSRSGQDEADRETGAAWVFTRSNGSWTQQAKLIADDAEAEDEFGYSVALDGDRALIGTQAFDGAAYVFERDGTDWRQVETIVHPEGTPGVFFGHGVDLDGDTALIAAHEEPDADGTETGAAYIFTASTDDTWTLRTTLRPFDGDDRNKFGFSVALDGSTALVGSPLAQGLLDEAGAGYVYERIPAQGWTLQSKLVPLAGRDLDRVGFSAALDGNTAILGSINGGNLDLEDLEAPDEIGDPEDLDRPESGAAYPFTTIS